MAANDPSPDTRARASAVIASLALGESAKAAGVTKAAAPLDAEYIAFLERVAVSDPDSGRRESAQARLDELKFPPR